MKNITLNITITTPFGNLYREATALVAVYKDNTVLLGGKRSYPTNIYRLLGGGIESNRDASAKAAATQELLEEINLKVPEDQLIEHAKITVQATDTTGKKYQHTVYLYGLQIAEHDAFKLDDDVDFIKYFSKEEIEHLITAYKELPREIDNTTQFAWFDYGQMYAPIHELLLENLS